MTNTPTLAPHEALRLAAYLSAEVEYRDGWLYWKHAVQGRAAGERLGSRDKRGYIRTQFMGRKWAVHRLVFLMHHGWLPDLVDHADGNKSNNLIGNLRAATKSQNTCNSKTRNDNALGVKGVYHHKASGRWTGSVMYQGRRWSKTFKTFEEACAQVSARRVEMHGEFTNYGA